ncbi:MAG: endolytic transglycosylase MltG [Candidatus Pacebacteria bacterium]|nr:endolytic transglycosylase MltG [Candidatus Paceibacterota bacterium]
MIGISDYLKAITLACTEHVRGTWKHYVVVLVCAVPLLVALWYVSPPNAFPTHKLITIDEGATLESASRSLKEHQVVRSALVLEMITRLGGNGTEIKAGKYYFETPVSAVTIASRIAHGEYGITGVRVTLIEGMTAKEMGETLAKVLPDFSEEAFVALAKPYEGMLFPDTYFILPGTPEAEVVTLLTDTFNEKTATLFENHSSNLSKKEIIILASLLEKEARGLPDKQRVAGIIMNRLKIDMRLQIDAVFGYILGRSGYTPTGDDLESGSPYNTYRVTGLPPGPIANPSLESLEAALTPEKTSFMYYLTGRDGFMYYARTFEEHKRNRELYLD